MKRAAIPRRHPGSSSSVSAVVLPPLARPEALLITADAEIARSVNHLRALARQNPTVKAGTTKPQHVIPPCTEPNMRYTQHHAVTLKPLHVAPTQELHPGNKLNNNDAETDLREVWRIASTTAKQQQCQKRLEVTPELNSAPYISRQVVRHDNQDEAEQHGTTLARYRRLVGMHARKTLLRIIVDATKRVARRRLEDACALKIGRRARQFLGRRRRERMRHHQLASVTRLQSFWRCVVARRRLLDLREERNRKLMEARRDRLRKNMSARTIQRHFHAVQARKRRLALTTKALREIKKRRACRVVSQAVLTWWSRRSRHASALQAPSQHCNCQTDEVTRSYAEGVESIRDEAWLGSNNNEPFRHSNPQRQDLSGSSILDSIAACSLVALDGVTFTDDVKEKQIETNMIELEKHAAPFDSELVGGLDDKSDWQLESITHSGNQPTLEHPGSWNQLSLEPIRTRPDTTDRQSQPLVINFQKNPSSGLTDDNLHDEGLEIFQSHQPSPKLSVSDRPDRMNKVVVDSTAQVSEMNHSQHHLDRIPTGRASQILRDFFTIRCALLARVQILTRRNAATSIQRVVRRFLARCEVSYRRQLDLISLRSELNAHWHQTGVELMASLFSSFDPAIDMDETQHDDVEMEEDDVVYNEDEDVSPSYCGLSWADVLPTRCGRFPSGLRLDLSHGPCSNKAPSLGLWRWSWDSEQWEPNPELFNISRATNEDV